MKILRFVLQSRGVSNLARRTAQIVTRFGVTPRRMGRRFERFLDVLDEYDITPTFPITALPMSRNPEFAHRLLERGAELAVHAWSHIDLTSLDLDGQNTHMGRAIQLFREHAVPFTGFRAPYLHWNDDTMRVVENFHFCYSSNQTVFWNVIDESALDSEQAEGLARGRSFYDPIDADSAIVLPFRNRGFVEIPVSLPDDEILLDRMYIHDAGYLGEVWRAILDLTWKRGELFTLQLHPERIDFFAGALGGMLREARSRKPGVWIATLDQIAQWWTDKSGNRVEIVRDGEKFRVDVRACPGSTVFVRENGAERTVDPGSFVIDTAGVRPCAGIAPGADRGLVQRLTEMGYVLETGAVSENYSVYLGSRDGADVATVRECAGEIEKCRGPMIRFGAWPHGNKSALAVTGDIDALTLSDFAHRFRGA
jgi:peptidoglycan/xylan/chitin deacetylase (PgdA/CDA1 family)